MFDLGAMLSQVGIEGEVQSWILRTLAVILSVVVVILARRLITAIVVAPLRYLVNRTPWKLDNTLFEASLGPLRLIIVAQVLVLIGRALLPDDSLYNQIAEGIARVVNIIAVMILLYRFIDTLISSSKQVFAMTGIVIEDRLLPFIRVGLKILLISVGVIVAMQSLGYDVNGLVAALGGWRYRAFTGGQKTHWPISLALCRL